MEAISTVLSEFIGAECAEKFLNVEIDVPCVKLAVSKALGLVVVLGALIVKLPQIVNIVRAGSGKGLSLLSVLLEIIACVFIVAYNVANEFAFSTWGESLFLVFGNAVILFLMLHLGGKSVAGVVALGAIAALVYGLIYSGYVSLEILQYLQASTIFIVAASKVPQIIQNFVAGNTGVLSAITAFLNLGGTAARVFTTLQEVDDQLILAGFVSAVALNFVLAAQIVWYWNAVGHQFKGVPSWPMVMVLLFAVAIQMSTSSLDSSSSVSSSGASQAEPRRPASVIQQRDATRVNFASVDCSAKVLESNKGASSQSSILHPNKDEYMLQECASSNKFVVIELCDVILVDTVHISNFEFFSSNPRDIRISVSERYPTRSWTPIGEFMAEDRRGVQVFHTEKRKYAKYVRVDFLTHYGEQFYCPVTAVRVYGVTEIDMFRESESTLEEHDDDHTLLDSLTVVGAMGGDGTASEENKDESSDRSLSAESPSPSTASALDSEISSSTSDSTSLPPTADVRSTTTDGTNHSTAGTNDIASSSNDTSTSKTTSSSSATTTTPGTSTTATTTNPPHTQSSSSTSSTSTNPTTTSSNSGTAPSSSSESSVSTTTGSSADTTILTEDTPKDDGTFIPRPLMAGVLHIVDGVIDTLRGVKKEPKAEVVDAECTVESVAEEANTAVEEAPLNDDNVAVGDELVTLIHDDEDDEHGQDMDLDSDTVEPQVVDPDEEDEPSASPDDPKTGDSADNTSQEMALLDEHNGVNDTERKLSDSLASSPDSIVAATDGRRMEVHGTPLPSTTSSAEAAPVASTTTTTPPTTPLTNSTAGVSGDMDSASTTPAPQETVSIHMNPSTETTILTTTIDSRTTTTTTTTIAGASATTASSMPEPAASDTSPTTTPPLPSGVVLSELPTVSEPAGSLGSLSATTVRVGGTPALETSAVIGSSSSSAAPLTQESVFITLRNRVRALEANAATQQKAMEQMQREHDETISSLRSTVSDMLVRLEVQSRLLVDSHTREKAERNAEVTQMEKMLTVHTLEGLERVHLALLEVEDRWLLFFGVYMLLILVLTVALLLICTSWNRRNVVSYFRDELSRRTATAPPPRAPTPQQTQTQLPPSTPIITKSSSSRSSISVPASPQSKHIHRDSSVSPQPASGIAVSNKANVSRQPGSASATPDIISCSSSNHSLAGAQTSPYLGTLDQEDILYTPIPATRKRDSYFE